MPYAIKSILYASDLSPEAPVVFRHAVGLAHEFGAKLHVVTVYRKGISLPEDKEEDQPHPGEDVLNTRIKEFDQKFPDYEVHKVLATVKELAGEPAKVILEMATELSADLIVLGSRGHNALEEVLLGSVSHKVLMKSKIPVFLVPFDRE
jgi:nucleotide-binding universal stress UspA family protein